MKNWKSFWEELPGQCAEEDFFAQVGKTVSKRPISEKMFEDIVSSVTSGLQLSPADEVLDICCGNGVVTKAIADRCLRVTGVDFSKTLIDIAVRHNSKPNITYLCADAAEVAKFLSVPFDKAFMYEALQHFSKTQFSAVLEQVRIVSRKPLRFFLGSVPDRQKIWRFYNTWRRKSDYLIRKICNQEAIGHWWSRSELQTVCAAAGFRVQFIEQPDNLHTSHYRFDALITEA